MSCKDRLMQLFAEDIKSEVLSEKQIDNILKYIEEERASDLSNDGIKNFRSKMNDIHKGLKIQRAKLKYKAAKTIEKLHDFTRYANDPLLKDTPGEAMMSYLGGSEWGVKGERTSVGQLQESLWESYLDIMNKEVDAKTLKAFGLQQTDELQLAKVLWNIEDNPGFDFRGIPKPILDVAKMMKKIQNKQLQDLGLGGADVTKAKNHIVKRHWDPEVMRNRGFGEWYEFHKNDFDDAAYKELKDKSEAGKKKFLEGVFKKITDGEHEPSVSADSFEDFIDVLRLIRSGKKEASKFTGHLTLKFKDPERWYLSNKEWGQKTIAAQFYKSMRQTARSAGLMQKMGPDPDRFLELMKKRAQTMAKGNPKALAEFNSRLRSIDNLYKEAKGFSSIPGDDIIAKSAAAMRQHLSVQLLGNVWASTLPDAAATSIAHMAGTGESMVGTYAKNISTFFNKFTGLERLNAGKDVQLAVDHVIANQFMEGSIDTMPPAMLERNKNTANKFFGGLSKFHRGMMNLTGLPRITNKGRDAVATVQATILGRNANKSLEQLHPRLQNTFNKYGIESKQWDVIRQAVKDYPGDRKILDPKMVAELPLDLFKGWKKNMSTELARREAEISLRNYLSDHANVFMRIPQLRSKSQMYQGFEAGTFWGEFARFFWQFKSFSYESINLARRINRSNPRGSNAYMMGSFITHSIGLGALSIWASDLGANREMSEVNADFAVKALVRSGGFAMYGDVVFNDYDEYGRNFLKNIAGPGISLLDDMFDVYGKAQSVVTGKGKRESFDAGLFERLGKRAAQVGLKQVPVVSGNFIWNKYALDQIINDNIMDELDPGFKVRKLRKQIKNGRSNLLDLESMTSGE